ncbi:MAG: exodeoxyribonuclease VII large subunit, partial [Verrucomicrobiales bacterium]
GVGDLQARFEALKRKLEAEGLFAADRKQALPVFPKTVGIVTSGTGAAIRDILTVLERRAPWVQPVLWPVRVQGKGAEREIAAAIRQIGEGKEVPACEVLIVGRGGGSLEDLWNFNEELVARAIAGCPIPVISAVGHEIDFTIADFVADLRAPTPSAAAELAVPDGGALRERLDSWKRRMTRRVLDQVRAQEAVLSNARRGVLSRGGERLLREPVMRVDALALRLRGATEVLWREQRRRLVLMKQSLDACRPDRQLAQREEKLGSLRQRLLRASQTQLSERDERIHRLRDLLRALGPELAFERGFSITSDDQGRIVRSVEELKEGSVLRTRLKDGVVESTVGEVQAQAEE